jgi:hypothetical protein
MKYLKTYEEQIYVKEYNPDLEKLFAWENRNVPYPPKFKIGDYVYNLRFKDDIIYEIINLDYNGDIHADTPEIIGWEYGIKYLSGDSKSSFWWSNEKDLELVPDYKVKANKYNL